MEESFCTFSFEVLGIEPQSLKYARQALYR